ncbi:hypothetical protein CYMTET_35762 [Cymbomonas tetramitiformis]|uniref:Uncharacterized protein n=1 Tax=Cymbomonas tetramitiformis TaxID=36881 RepID=A0AAE0F8L9_9CHLO|nr:hypothetical protein CYMTET_35762 [Cymbomonas tetramitiformis]
MGVSWGGQVSFIVHKGDAKDGEGTLQLSDGAAAWLVGVGAPSPRNCSLRAAKNGSGCAAAAEGFPSGQECAV